MEIIVEIGNDEEKALIQKEMELFLVAVEQIETKLNIDLRISQIIIPLDFDGKVNELQETTNYQAQKESGGAAMGKNVVIGDNVVIVLSPILYCVGEIFDTMVRYFLFFHELIHVVNRRVLPGVFDYQTSRDQYLSFLQKLYDEYSSDRLAFILLEQFFETPSVQWSNFVKDMAKNYLVTAEDQRYYNYIRNKIQSFRQHGRVDLFNEETEATIYMIAIATMHAFARYHHDIENTELLNISATPFVNQKTYALANYLNGKFRIGKTDLSDGIDVIANYMTNFGIRFEDRPQGLYCHILDI